MIIEFHGKDTSVFVKNLRGKLYQAMPDAPLLSAVSGKSVTALKWRRGNNKLQMAAWNMQFRFLFLLIVKDNLKNLCPR